MKKIIFSLAIIAAIGAIVVGATTAYFSDTETSTGNTFTAGVIDLKVDSEQHYNGMVCSASEWIDDGSGTSIGYPVAGTECGGTWGQEGGLDITNEKFFDFIDVKPGDFGENTISLHIINNDAYVCAAIIPTNNAENGLTEPEEEMNDDSLPSDPWNGELADNLQFFAWADDGDNIFEAGEQPLFSNVYGPASDLLPNGKVYPLYTPQTGALSGGDTTYLGLAWCAGDMTVNINDGIITCDGSTMGNESQSDSFKADISFYIEQARHNENFTCDGKFDLPNNQNLDLDYLDIGNLASEAGHNLIGWSDPWVKPGWGGNYGGGSSDNSLRLLMGHGDTCDVSGNNASFTMNAGSYSATQLIIEHLDGSQDDSFEVYVNGALVGNYTGGQTSSENWVTSTFNFSPTSGEISVELVATELANNWCLSWGQVGFSNVLLK